MVVGNLYTVRQYLANRYPFPAEPTSQASRMISNVIPGIDDQVPAKQTVKTADRFDRLPPELAFS
jgi:hypothetical protein